MPENKDSTQLISEILNTVNEKTLEIDESISLFQDDEEEINADDNKYLHNNTNQTGRKSFVGGLSKEIFFTLYHTLNAHADAVVYLLVKKYICSCRSIQQ